MRRVCENGRMEVRNRSGREGKRDKNGGEMNDKRME